MQVKEKIKQSEETFSVFQNITATIRDAKTGKIKRVYKERNLVATAGRTVLAMILSNDLTYTGVINYGLLGTSTTAPANADTKLGTEAFRKAPSSNTNTANVANISFYYTAGDCNGTYKEFGTVIDGGAGADSGQLFSHVAVDWVKSAAETLTVDCQYTIS